MYHFQRTSSFVGLALLCLVLSACGRHLSERLPNLSAGKGSGVINRDLAQSVELAIQNGLVEEVKAFLDAGFPANQILNTGYTLLQQSIISTKPTKFEAMFQVLIGKGADPFLRDANGNTSLDLAKNKRIALRMLQPEKNNEMLKQLFADLAAEQDRARIVAIFTDEGEDVNVIEPESGHTPLTLAISLKSRKLFAPFMEELVEEVNINKRNGNGISPLRLAETNPKWNFAVAKLTELGAKE